MTGHGMPGGGVVLVLWPVLAAISAAYLVAAGRTRSRGRGWSGWRSAVFLVGTGLLAVAVSPPVGAWAHHDLRGHMLQHLLIGMFAPLALVLATPATLLLRTLSVPSARRLAALLKSCPVGRITHPATALLLDAGALYVLYLTPLFAATLASPYLHGVVHLHFFAAGFLFAWSIAGRDPAPHRPGFGTRLGVLFVAIAAHSTLAKLMYAHGWPRGTHHDLEQIRAAARLMYYGGDVAELLLAIALFAAWYRAGGRQLARRSRALTPACALRTAGPR